MTLLDVIVVMGTVELAALVAILAALVRKRADHSTSGLARGVPGRAPVVHAGAGRAVSRHPLVPPRPEGESAPGG